MIHISMDEQTDMMEINVIQFHIRKPNIVHINSQYNKSIYFVVYFHGGWWPEQIEQKKNKMK